MYGPRVTLCNVHHDGEWLPGTLEAWRRDDDEPRAFRQVQGHDDRLT